MEFRIGDKVMMVSKDAHKDWASVYPPYGTTGIIVEVNPDVTYDYLIQWKKGTTSGHDLWWVSEDKIELVESRENINMDYTDEEVWAFLAPKMSQFTNTNFVYNEVMKMVVAAYRSGYGRAIKGRSFEIKPKSWIANGSVVEDINKLLDGMNLWGVYGLYAIHLGEYPTVYKYKFKHTHFDKNRVPYDSLKVLYLNLDYQIMGWDTLMHDVLYVEGDFSVASEGDLVTNPKSKEKFVGKIVKTGDRDYVIQNLNADKIYHHVPILDGSWKRLVPLTVFLEDAGINLTPYKKKN